MDETFSHSRTKKSEFIHFGPITNKGLKAKSFLFLSRKKATKYIVFTERLKWTKHKYITQ